jgi:hypothetical protein
MWTREDIRREVAEAFKPDPPKPKPTSEQKAEERWANPPDEAVLQNAAKSAEAQLAMAERWRDRRSERIAKEYTEYQVEQADPRVRYQRELDAWWEQQRRLADALDDGYIEIGGFRERRRGAMYHRGKGDPDYGL